ncbi:NADH dehydrogenase [ubiquinone] 1 beta subcomplex subunit 4 [Neodiprion pinetum]|uniref:NADH dehydrogenase [ubiquinone] 1 beta subcomplex subunit 4 n=1 Tax=Neodiprion lecontei TaxID=441921 RepID=A0A6J0BAV8_NEOLC|nr:NADH dehydrogenase [ubiquinone] 1 beta subcomplex subunit 4 [Neodiprion lecontei]XP_046422695.1 NADH dehydrogenase [ubiquinone] 1 beta subcomplex subunit 4 [Neodiprion fabricii]XP_046478771.1 NADH dehydrogenase [ubiquinone] 1 beta subcomplex subunit 4 [Neodiprion pinetum]XP_046616219.1 NADH dehydrogenase [ubiquinone] 1 beta subcomplex subunit 4 [Neodiprion virginianus]
MTTNKNNYDISPEQLRLEIKRNARRNELRQELQKIAGNPYRAGTGEGGAPFDAGLQRFMAARAKTYEYFRPTLKGGLQYYAAIWTPILFFTWLVKRDRDRKEHRFRTGQVSYADREFKFA